MTEETSRGKPYFVAKLDEYCDSEGRVVIAHVPAMGTSLPSSVAHFRGKALFELELPDGNRTLHEAYFPLPVRLKDANNKDQRRQALEVCFEIWDAEYASYQSGLQKKLTASGGTKGASRELAPPSKLVLPSDGEITKRSAAIGDRPIADVMKERGIQ